jgi:hypothetical protein
MMKLVGLIFRERGNAIGGQSGALFIAIIFPDVPEPGREQSKIARLALGQENLEELPDDFLLPILLGM